MEKNDLILITGVNGYIGSHTADQALASGYRVRGSVRNLESTQWLQEYFDNKYGTGRFERISILHYAAEDVSGVIHVAVDTALTGKPEPYISEAVKSIVNLLKSASQSSVKRFVYTSSSTAASDPKVNVEWTIPVDSYNDEAVKQAYTEPFEQAKMWSVYAASKATAERAAWKWVADNKPSFGFNTVLPNANFGPSLVPAQQGLPSTGGWPKMFFDGNFEILLPLPPQHFVDVRDDAKILLMALTEHDVNNERLFAYAEPYNWNQVLAIIRRLYPDRKFADDIPGIGKDLSKPPSKRAEELLKRCNQPAGWTSLEQSLRDALASVQ